MRLTLRTLLAYLDDELSPADTKIIGQKIQESPMAQLLVSRIREVVRKRRLKAPEISGPEMGIDPNTVSQYLNDTLPVEQYADVERVFLASDELLAEVAACHQILTVTLADPSELPLRSRERLYALGPVDAASRLSVPLDAPAPAGARTPRSISIPAVVSGSMYESLENRTVDNEPPLTAVPDYLKSAPWSQRMFPSAMIALMVILCAALLLPDFIKGLGQANNEIRQKTGVGKDKSTTEAESVSEPDRQKLELAARSGDVPASPAPLKFRGTVAPTDVDPEPPADEPSEFLTPKPRPDTEATPAPVEPRESPAIPMAPEADIPPAPAPEPKEPSPSVQILYTSNEGVLLHQDPTNSHWFVTPHRSSLKLGEVVANLEPFESTIDVDQGSVRLTLIGETVLRPIVDAKSVGAAINIRCGKIVFQSGRQDENHASLIGVAIGDDLWKLQLMSSDTVCALDVIPREPLQFQHAHDNHWYQATLYVLSGEVKWSNGAGKTQVIGDSMELNINPERDVVVRPSPISFPFAPDWVEPSKRKLFPLRRYQGLFEKMFELNQPVELLMMTQTKNSRNPKLAELAARSLSATESYAALVQTLAECTHEEARFAARDGLRQWLPRHPENGALLKKELDSHYPPADADAVYQLLWGFSRDDVKDSKTTSLLIVSWMRNHRQEIREMADYWVERLTGRKTEYRASWTSQSQREPHVRRLEEQIDRDNGLIKHQ